MIFHVFKLKRFMDMDNETSKFLFEQRSTVDVKNIPIPTSEEVKKTLEKHLTQVVNDSKITAIVEKISEFLYLSNKITMDLNDQVTRESESSENSISYKNLLHVQLEDKIRHLEDFDSSNFLENYINGAYNRINKKLNTLHGIFDSHEKFDESRGLTVGCPSILGFEYLLDNYLESYYEASELRERENE